MLGIMTIKGVIQYAAFPQIMPRLKSLVTGGFSYVPYFMAVVYQMVGLLPANHPYLHGSNIGRYGIRHVVSQAAHNLKFSLKNIDQIILFVAVLVGLVIFALQFIALAAMIFLQPVGAMPTDWNGFFVVTNPQQDLAFIMLDMVFGVPNPDGSGGGLFESCIGVATPCQNNFAQTILDADSGGATFTTITSTELSQMGPFATDAYNSFPFPMHLGLHQLFSVYSTGLLVVAVGIASYFVATILAETAQSGTPFGRRFNKMWAPLRIVVAFGLLLPVGSGLNSSQYLVLYAAKYGSAFATNGWSYFNDLLNEAYNQDGRNMISVPRVPDMMPLMQFLHVAKTCRLVQEYYDKKAAGLDVQTDALPVDDQVHPYVIGRHSDTTNRSYRVISTTSYDNVMETLIDPALADPPLTNIMTIRFGIENQDTNSQKTSFIGDECGEIRLDLSDPKALHGGAYYDVTTAADDNTTPATNPHAPRFAPYWAQRFYFYVIMAYWFDNGDIATDGGAGLGGNTVLLQQSLVNHRHNEAANRFLDELKTSPIIHGVPLDAEYVRDLREVLADRYDNLIDGSFQTMGVGMVDQVHANLISSSTYVDKGWAAAGIWYNRLAEMNGIVNVSMTSVPEVRRYPAIMEEVYDLKVKYDKQVDTKRRYEPKVAGVDSIGTLLSDRANGEDFARILWAAFDLWNDSAQGQSIERPKYNPMLQAISFLLGTNGLYDMRNNPNTHPLAQLSGIGRSLVESSIRSLGFAAMSSAAGVLGAVPQQLAKTAASFFVTIATLGLTVGFILFYVVPFLPFIYFYFAVGGWIKGVFEALVGAPLWALAHIRIDGHGMSGQAAMNGYFLIFEVFLRPILIVFGLLASISIFAALVTTLNSVFTLVSENASGYDLESELEASRGTLTYMRSLVDEFFFTVIYAILVYMLGMSSFKLIDTVPNNILRWMGQSVATFGDQRENPAEGLVSKMSVGSQQVTSKLGGGLQQSVKAAGGIKPLT